jgi:hypothetical protein
MLVMPVLVACGCLVVRIVKSFVFCHVFCPVLSYFHVEASSVGETSHSALRALRLVGLVSCEPR